MRGVTVADEQGLAVPDALDQVRAQPTMEGSALVANASTPAPYVVGEEGRVRVAVVDYGLKRSILRRLDSAGAAVTVYPHVCDPDDLAGHDGVLLSEWPGRPGAARRGDPRGAGGARPGAHARDPPRPPADGARDRARDDEAPLRAPRGQPPRARPPQRPRARHEPEPRVRGRPPPSRRRRRTSRSTTEPSRDSTSPTCARSPCSSIRRPARGRTMPGRSSSAGSRGSASPRCPPGAISARSA